MCLPGNLSRLQRTEVLQKKKNLKKKYFPKAKIILTIRYEKRIVKETAVSTEPLNEEDCTTVNIQAYSEVVRKDGIEGEGKINKKKVWERD